MPNNKTKVNEPHRNWKPYSVSSELIELLAQSSTSSTNHQPKVFINGYLCGVVCIFLSVAFFDFYRKSSHCLTTYPPPSTDSESDIKTFYPHEHPRFPLVYKGILSRHSRLLRVAVLYFSVVMAAMLCAGAVFVPYLALPLAQEVCISRFCQPS
jgi:hypothetical protein